MRKIIHIDMDAFYASVEQRDNPQLRGKAIAVGSSEARGVVSTASYEARRYGVGSAMPSRTALQRCPHLIFVRPRFEAYKEVSRQLMNIFLDYTDLVEPLSLDEAFLDVTVNHKGMPSATEIAKEIKQRIKAETGLTASAGVSVNKFLAKVASDYRKPDGLFVIKPDQAESFVETLPIERFFGVGRVTAAKMHRLGIAAGADLKKKSRFELVSWFGRAGMAYYHNARGIDYRQVQPHRVRKSVGAENTFDHDLTLYHEQVAELEHIAGQVASRVEKAGFQGRTLTLKIKYADFEICSRSRTLPQAVRGYDTILSEAVQLLDNIGPLPKPVRLLGISVKSLEDARQLKDPLQLEIDFDWEA